MRTTRTLASAAALSALATTALLVPSIGTAAAATPVASQKLTGYCSAHDDPAPLSSSTQRVSLNEPVGPDDRHSGFAEAATLSAGAFVKAQRNTLQPVNEDCDTQTSFANAVRVLPGSSDLPIGEPVVLAAVIDLSAELGSSHDAYKRSSATSFVSSLVTVEDPGASCDDPEWCNTEVVRYSASAERDLNNVDPAFSENGSQGVYLDVNHNWSAYGSAQEAELGDGDAYSKVLCTTFPCQDAVPGEYAGAHPPLTYAPGQQSVLFHTHVGARLIVRGKVVTGTYAGYGSTIATSRTLQPLTTTIQQTDTTGLEIVVGDGAVDSTKPTTSSTVDVAPNGPGWNRDDVTVTITAQDETALSGISYVATGAQPGTGSTGTGSISVPVTAEGVTQLSWTATDVAGNSTSGTRVIRIDRTAPVVTVPDGKSEPALADGTAVVHWASGSSDALSGNATFACTPPSGSTFTIGTHPVVCTATDVAGNAASRQFHVTITRPDTVADHIAAIREMVTLNPMDEILRKQLLNDLVLLEKAYEKGRGATKGCKELDDLQARVTAATSIEGGTKQVILFRAAQLDQLLGC